MLKFPNQNKLKAALTPRLKSLGVTLPSKRLSKGGRALAPKSLVGGFTLVEMLVSLAILAIIASILLFDSRRFEGQVALTNLAHEVAVELRMAQTSAVGSARPPQEMLVEEGFSGNIAKGLCPDGSAGFPQGVIFQTTNAVERSKFTSFIDTDCDHEYDPPQEELRVVQLIQGVTIKELVVNDNVLANDVLTVIFERPNLGAEFYFDTSLSESVSLVKIVLENDRGSTRSVVVTSVGQIYVE